MLLLLDIYAFLLFILFHEKKKKKNISLKLKPFSFKMFKSPLFLNGLLKQDDYFLKLSLYIGKYRVKFQQQSVEPF